MEKNDKFKILPAYLFHYVKESRGKKEVKAELALGELVKELEGFKGDLVFIPVNNPNFHWSLLVYEVREKRFWHYDSLGGANWGYVEGLVRELLENILQTKEIELEESLVAKNDIRQGNGWDCGIAVIAITRRIRELWSDKSWTAWLKYRTFNLESDLGKFNFQEERKELRERYLSEEILSNK